MPEGFWNPRLHPDPSFERYAAEIRRLDRVEASEESALIAEARRGSLPARNRLIKAHMRFVLKVALHYRACPVPVADLVNEGVLGLVRAIESYERTNIKFISYAVWWIRSYMVRAIEDRGALIRLPANEHARLRKLKRDRKAGGGEEPGWVRAQGCMDRPGTPEGGDWADTAPLADEILASERRTHALRTLLERLPEQETFVIRNVYGIDQEEGGTLKSIGREMGLSLERVRQIREKALVRMRKESALR